MPRSVSNPSLRGKPASQGGSSCSSAYTQCFNLISDIHALPANLQIAAVNKSSSAGGCGGVNFETDVAATVCPAAAHSSQYLAPAGAGQAAWTPPPPPTVYDIDKFFTNMGNSQDIVWRRGAPGPSPSVYAPLDAIAYGIIGIAGLVFVVLVLVLFRSSTLQRAAEAAAEAAREAAADAL